MYIPHFLYTFICQQTLRTFLRRSIFFFWFQGQGNKYTTKTLHFRRLFSILLVSGISTRMRRKYRIDAGWPMMINGCWTGCTPTHVDVSRSAISNQNNHWLRDWNVVLCCFDARSIGMIATIRMETSRASMLPNLLGTGGRIGLSGIGNAIRASCLEKCWGDWLEYNCWFFQKKLTIPELKIKVH